MNKAIREKIKLLWIIFSRRWGGPEQVAISDMIDLCDAGVQLNILCLDGSPIHAAVLRHPKIRVFAVPDEPKGWFDRRFYRKVGEIIDVEGVNIIHINDERLHWYLEPLLFRRPKVALIASRNVLAERGLPEYLFSFLFRRLDYLIVLNEGVKASVLARRVISEKKIRVINLGLDFSRFDPKVAQGKRLREAWGADKDTIVIGSVGRLVAEIGQETFIKAAASLMKTNRWKIRFVIIGEDPLVATDDYLGSLKALAQQFHLTEHIIFRVLEENLPEIMAAFDIFVMAGTEEVPGLGALEALAMERPVVLSRVVGAEEIVGNRKFGLLVRSEDAFDLQSKILDLLDNPSQRLEMGREGRTHVLKHFDKRTRLIRSLDLYERCLRRRLGRQKYSL